MRVMSKRVPLAGYALFLGAVMLLMFWINSVRDSEASIISMPWRAQVAFHGVMNLLLAAGWSGSPGTST
ncbi:MAG TPA: hypothetical protein VFY46_07440 [Acidimicrobiia bacterium]|nr:hypothetical protein [Acidimicrobiia bacterium]